MLSEYNINVIEQVVTLDFDEALEFASSRYPVAVKGISEKMTHKTEVGLVKLGIKNEEELKSAWNEIYGKMEGAEPEGIAVQRMARKGIELIVGGREDVQFGPVVMFGLGGIFVEIFRDFSLRVCPISERDADEMIKEIRGYPLLLGTRGTEGANIQEIKKLLLNFSDMLVEKRVNEIDLNPVIAYRDGYVVVDARVKE